MEGHRVMPTIWRGGLFIGVAVIAAGVVVLAVTTGRDAQRPPLHPHASLDSPHLIGCKLRVGGPGTKLYTCGGRAYVWQGHSLLDNGPMTPMPGVPKA